MSGSKKEKFNELLNQLTLGNVDSQSISDLIFSYAMNHESDWTIEDLLEFDSCIESFGYTPNYFDGIKPFLKYIANTIHNIKYYGYIDKEKTNDFRILANNVLGTIDLEEYLISQRLSDNKEFDNAIQECLKHSSSGMIQHFEFLENQALILGEAKLNTVYVYLKNLLKSKSHLNARTKNAKEYKIDQDKWELGFEQLINFILSERRRISLNNIFVDENSDYPNAFFEKYNSRTEQEDFFIKTFSFYNEYHGAIFRPINPYLIITAISISKVMKCDYRNFIKNYIFSFDEVFLLNDLIDSYEDFSIEDRVSILKSESECWELFKRRAQNILINNGKLINNQLPTRWHLEWLYWCIVNESFKTSNELYQKASMSLSSMSGLIINTEVHNFRTRLESKEMELKTQLNIAFENAEDDIEHILLELEFCELALERIVLIYENLPHEIWAYGSTELAMLEMHIKTVNSRDRLLKESLSHKEKVNSNFIRRKKEATKRPISKGEIDYHEAINEFNEVELLDHYKKRLINTIKYRLIDSETLESMGYSYDEILKTNNYE